MAYPTLPIANGPGHRDLEQAFAARHLGATARFKVCVGDQLTYLRLRILNFKFVTCHGPNYEIGGELADLAPEQRRILPPFNFIFVRYNSEERSGTMEFSNAG